MSSQNRLMFLMELKSCSFIERKAITRYVKWQGRGEQRSKCWNTRREKMITEDCLPQALLGTVREATRLYSPSRRTKGVLFSTRFYNIEHNSLLLICPSLWPESLKSFVALKISWTRRSFRGKSGDIQINYFGGETKFRIF